MSEFKYTVEDRLKVVEVPEHPRIVARVREQAEHEYKVATGLPLKTAKRQVCGEMVPLPVYPEWFASRIDKIATTVYLHCLDLRRWEREADRNARRG